MSNTSNQTQELMPKSNIVSFASRRSAQLDQTDPHGTNDACPSNSEGEKLVFNDAIKKNMDNAERLRKERLKANQGVLKSYKIKN